VAGNKSLLEEPRGRGGGLSEGGKKRRGVVVVVSPFMSLCTSSSEI